MSENIKNKLKEMFSDEPDIVTAIEGQLKVHGLINPVTRRMLLSLAVGRSNENISAICNFANPLLKAIKRSTSPLYKPNPDDNINGILKVGTTESGLNCGLDFDDYHLLISGITRSGKSMILSHLLLQGMQQKTKIVCWFFSRATESKKLLAQNKDIVVVNFDGQVRINPIPNNEEGFCNFIDPFIQAVYLYDGSDNFLTSHLSELLSASKNSNSIPNIYDLYRKISSINYPRNSRLDYYKQSVTNRLDGLLKGRLGMVFKCRKGQFHELINHHTVFQINNLKSWERILVVNWLILELYRYKQNNPDASIHHIIALDDAMPIFHKGFDYRKDNKQPIIADILDTTAKAKIQIFISIQSPSTLMECALSETATKIMLKMVDDKDIKCMLSKMGLNANPKISEYCSNLPLRKAVIFMGNRDVLAFVVNIPEIYLAGRDISDEEIYENNARLLNLKNENGSTEENLESFDSTTDSDKPDENKLSSGELALLWDIHLRPYISRDERYKTFNP